MGIKKYAVIVAGGSGTRMKSWIPKQFLLLKGRPILMHTLEAFHAADPQTILILALPESHFDTWYSLCKTHHFTLPVTLVKGGETRFESVSNSLAHVDKGGYVAVHDAVRPLVTSTLINKLFEAVLENKAVIPCIEVTESLRKVDDERNTGVDRSNFRIVQTPQCFSSSILKEAYKLSYRPEFTDDASVVEASGESLHIVEGERYNIKITTPEDLQFAEFRLAHRSHEKADLPAE